MGFTDELVSQKDIFFGFMKEKYPVCSNSNIFLRDLQYAIKNYFAVKNKKIKTTEAEKIAKEFAEKLSASGTLKKVSENAWKLNFSLQKNVTPISNETVTQP